MHRFLYGTCIVALTLTALTAGATPPALPERADPVNFDDLAGDMEALFDRLKALPPLPVVPQKPTEKTPDQPTISDDMADVLNQLPPVPEPLVPSEMAKESTLLETSQELVPAPAAADVSFEPTGEALPDDSVTDTDTPAPTIEAEAVAPLPEPDAAAKTTEPATDIPADVPPVSNEPTPAGDTVSDIDSAPLETTGGVFQNALFNGDMFPLFIPENADTVTPFSLMPKNMTCSVTQNTDTAAVFECAYDTLGFHVTEKPGGGLDLTPELPGLKPQDHLLTYQVTSLGNNPDRAGYCLIHRVITGASEIVGVDLVQTPAASCGDVGVKPNVTPSFITPHTTPETFKDTRFYGDILINGETWRLHPDYITHITPAGGTVEQCALLQDDGKQLSFECITTDATGTLPPKRVFRTFQITDNTPPQVRLKIGETNALTGTETIGRFDTDITRLVLKAFAKKAAENKAITETTDATPAKVFQNDLFSHPLRRADEAPDQPGGLFGLTPGQKMPPLVVKDNAGNSALYDRYCTLARDDVNALVFDCDLNAQPGTPPTVSLPKKAFVTLAVRDCDTSACYIVQAVDTDSPHPDEGPITAPVYTPDDIDRLAQNTERFTILNVDVAAVIQEDLTTRASEAQPLNKVK